METYHPEFIEKKWYDYWERHKLFSPKDSDADSYTIVIPPPNVTGILHMGHVLNNTLQDILIRFRRMQGHNTLWIPGTDHAGIATQNKVEQELAKENKNKHDLGRENFVNRVWEWKDKHGGIIIQQLKKLGCSCDWDRERFTMDTGLSHAVRKVFVELFDKGLIYRGKYIVNWCPRCHTALSDEEVEHKVTNGKLWYIRYPGLDGSEDIVVATTRPETMLGDVAVAVHPDDKRYVNILGKSVILPLQNRAIPVIADEMVDREFGTGSVKITPAHDANDFEAGQRHNFKPIVVIDETGHMTRDAGASFEGLDRYECRKKVVDDLDAQGLLIKVEDYQNSVGQCYRCNTVIEPYLSSQWFVKMKPLAKPALKAVTNGEIHFYPDRWTKVYLNWMENIRDWCISRQLWWGHRIPVWKCEECGYFKAFVEDPVSCPKCNSQHFIQDPDVLDTWFSSWLWPFSSMGWPDETKDLDRFYPTNDLTTAPEIIFFWVARMIMASYEFMNQKPFENVYLHGTVRDSIGRKMSKSLGNSPDPLEIIDKYGADALRFGMVMISPRGSDIFFSEDSLNAGRTFANKVWNASKLIISNIEIDFKPFNFDELDMDKMRIADKWILYRLTIADKEINDHLKYFRFNDAAIATHRFIWHEFCDWYLEIAKLTMYQSDNPEYKRIVLSILVKILDQILKLLHPFMPFITEEIWSNLHPDTDSIMLQSLENISRFETLEKDAAKMDIIKRAIISIRTIRSETHIPPSRKIHAAAGTKLEIHQEILKHAKDQIMFLCRLDEFIVSMNPDLPKIRATSVTEDGIDVFVDLEGIVDVPKEIERLNKEISKASTELHKVTNKLENENFMLKAPAQIVEKNRRIHNELTEKISKLQIALNLFTGYHDK